MTTTPLAAHDIIFLAFALAAFLFIAYAAYRWLWTWGLAVARFCFALWVAGFAVLLAWEYSEPVIRHMLDTGQIALPFLTQGVTEL